MLYKILPFSKNFELLFITSLYSAFIFEIRNDINLNAFFGYMLNYWDPYNHSGIKHLLKSQHITIISFVKVSVLPENNQSDDYKRWCWAKRIFPNHFKGFLHVFIIFLCSSFFHIFIPNQATIFNHKHLPKSLNKSSLKME